MQPEEHEVFISVVVVQRPLRVSSRSGVRAVVPCDNLLDPNLTQRYASQRQTSARTTAIPSQKRPVRLDKAGWLWFGLGLLCCLGSALSFYLFLQTQ